MNCMMMMNYIKSWDGERATLWLSYTLYLILFFSYYRLERQRNESSGTWKCLHTSHSGSARYTRWWPYRHAFLIHLNVTMKVYRWPSQLKLSTKFPIPEDEVRSHSFPPSLPHSLILVAIGTFLFPHIRLEIFLSSLASKTMIFYL